MAVAAAISAPALAQNVTISGLFDTGIAGDTITGGAAGTTPRKTSFTGVANRASTSVLNFQAVEDLGGGLKATVFANQTLNSGTGAFGVRDHWAALSGSFGEVKLGRYAPGFETVSASYAMGGGTTLTAGTADFMYGSLARDNTAGTESAAPQAVYTEIGRGGASQNATNTGVTGHMQYTSPTMNGLTAILGYGKASNDTSATNSSTSFTQSEFSLNFVNGPVSIGAGFLAGNASTENTPGTERDIDMMHLGASVNLDGIIIRVGHIKRSEDLVQGGTPVVDADATSFGITIPVGGAASAYATAYSGADSGKGAGANQRDHRGYQVGLVYNLSKRSNVYAVYGQNEFEGQTVAASSKIVGTSVGLRHSF